MTEHKGFSHQARVKAGDCYLTDNLVSNVGSLFQGMEVTPLAIVDLCQLIDASILHDNLIIGGISPFSNVLGERLHKEGIIRLAYGAGVWEEEDDYPQDELFQVLLETIVDVMDPNSPYSGTMSRLFVTLPHSPNPSMKFFELTTLVTAIRECVVDAEPAAVKILEEEYGPMFSKYEEYARVVAQIPRHYEIPVFSGAAEQPILGKCAIDLAITDEASRFLMDTFGDHYRRHVGGIIDAIPVPPLAGIVLKDADSINEIINQLLKYRAKFEPFRKTANKLRLAMIEARRERTTSAAMEYRRLCKELELSLKRSIERLEAPAKPKRKLVFRIWDLVKLLNPQKMVINGMDQAVTKAEQIDQSRISEGVFEVVSYFPIIPSLDAIAERLFQKKYQAEYLEKFTTGVERLAACHGLRQDQEIVG